MVIFKMYSRRRPPVGHIFFSICSSRLQVITTGTRRASETRLQYCGCQPSLGNMTERLEDPTTPTGVLLANNMQHYKLWRDKANNEHNMNSALKLKIGHILYCECSFFQSCFDYKTRLWRGFDLHLIILVVFACMGKY